MSGRRGGGKLAQDNTRQFLRIKYATRAVCKKSIFSDASIFGLGFCKICYCCCCREGFSSSRPHLHTSFSVGGGGRGGGAGL